MSDEKDKAQAALENAPETGQVYSERYSSLGVITTSVREGTLEPVVTFRRNRSPAIWTMPLETFLDTSSGSWQDSSTEKLAWAALAGVPKRGQIYRHYKGGLYSVVTTSLEVGTLTPLVTYISNFKGTTWTRTLANFTERLGIECPWGHVPRFRRENA